MATTDELDRRLKEVEAWKTARERQQISFPLDTASVEILSKLFLSLTNVLEFANSSGLVNRALMLKQDGKVNVVGAYASLVRYTANASSNVITATQDVVALKNGSFSDGQQVIVLTTGTPPAPLAESTPYYVVNAAGDGRTFKLSATFGGAAINITDGGSGEQYIYVFS